MNCFYRCVKVFQSGLNNRARQSGSAKGIGESVFYEPSLVAWAEKLLKHSPPGPAAEGSVLSKLRDSLEILPACKPFINRFLRDAKPLLTCQKVLKTE